MKQLRISVALCTYNGAHFLSEQLESFAGQTKPPSEVVICDDQSSDHTVRIVREFAARAPFPVRLEVNETNLGSTKNFERAVGLCEGEIIALADQDDVWESQKLEIIAGTFREQPEIGYVFSDAELIDEAGSHISGGLWELSGFSGTLFKQFTNGSQVTALLRRSIATGATMAFRSSLKGAIMPFSPHFVHDCWISTVASCIGAHGVPISEKLIRYRQHGAQQIGARRKSTLQRFAIFREESEHEYCRAKLGMRDLRDRLLLSNMAGQVVNPTNMNLVEEKLDHCTRRAGAHEETGLTRARRVFAEVLTGRYVRFSNSWRSVIADLCF